MYLERIMAQRLRQVAGDFPAVLLSGARQSGKTTLLRACFAAHRYVSLDLPSTAELAERSPADFLRAHPPPLVVDEVQYAPGLFRHLKVAIDARRHLVGQLLLTGSQKFTLMRSVSDSLAGRCGWLELENLAVPELSGAADPRAGVPTEVMVRGLFPELWASKDRPTDDFYRSYVATYVERDVRELLHVVSLRDFERFMRLCATYSGQLLNRAEMARALGIGVDTVNRWLGVLQASNQVVLLEPYFVNVGKRLTKSPKLYFADVGMASFLLGVDVATLPTSPFVGALWETLVFAELRKYLQHALPRGQLFFYRDQQGREVDFVLLFGGRAILVESKWAELPDAHDARSMAIVAQLLARAVPAAVPVAARLVAARPPHAFPLADGSWAVPGLDIAAHVAEAIASLRASA